MKFRLSFQISLLCVAGALNSGAVLIANAVLQSPPDIRLCFGLGFGFVLVFWTFGKLLKRMNTITRLVLIALVPLVMWRMGIFTLLYDFFTAYGKWIYTYNLAEPEPDRFGVLSTLILTGILSGIPAACFVASTPKILITLTFYLAVIFSPYPFVDMPQFFFAANVIVIALLMFAVLSEYTRKAVRYGTKLSPLPYQMIGIPACALIILISMQLPWSETGHPERIPKGLMDFVQNGGFSLFPADYGLNETGRVELGGGNRMGSGLLFTLESDSPMYVYAECYDRYTGRAWVSSHGGLFFEYSPGAYNSFKMTELEYKAPESFLFNIEYSNLSTDILLMPHNISYPIMNSREHQLLMTRDMVFRVNPDAVRGMAYSAMYEVHKINELIDMDIFIYEVLGRETYRKVDLSIIPELTDYLQLPDTVTDRTRELALDITLEKITKIEKALAIEDYLSSSYPYTLEAPRLPMDTDFVDFFLFDAKTGYCTSYASAMTVMLRSVGIPARYCEGFAPNANSGENGVYSVYESDAHAWVEAYIPFIGWVEFDPTGSSNAGSYRNAARATPTPTPAAAPEVTPTSAPTPEPDEIPDTSPTPAPTPEPAQTGEEKTAHWLTEFLIKVLWIVLPPFAWFFGTRLYIRLRLKYTARRHPNAQARFWYKRIKGLLKAEGLVIHNYETMREFALRAQEKLPSSGIDLLPAIALLEKTRYNGEDMTIEELDAFRTAHRQLMSGLHAGWHPVRQWWETYITLRLRWR